MAADLYIGLMSGTSMDGIDAALVDFATDSISVRATHFTPYPDDLRQQIQALAVRPDAGNLLEIGMLNSRIAKAFASATLDLLAESAIDARNVAAVGSHGQTILHHPRGDDPFSFQLGDPGIVAAATGIPVVADFRNTDIALGGQGAPLAPAFHRFAFGDPDNSRAVVNIGGIANVTLLLASGRTEGFDTGPGNVLLDLWSKKHLRKPFDDKGLWAAGGTVDSKLLKLLQADSFFALKPPKSTGSDYFSLDWLDQKLKKRGPKVTPEDIQATLSELTALEIARPLKSIEGLSEVMVCGGGANNEHLMTALRRALPNYAVDTTAHWGIDPAWVEAIAFAWLARQRLLGAPSNIPTVTGARQSVSLGGVYLPPA